MFQLLAFGDVPDKGYVGVLPLICRVGTGKLNGNLGAILFDNGHLEEAGDDFAAYLSLMPLSRSLTKPGVENIKEGHAEQLLL